ncbi:MAG TPA: efflux RND transporter periplasmic adaptor subunit [Candidatus Deferrimicrobiaceae bacterium]|jgi:multidrug efflux pump subunit AcrA (membrane-fusion protein)
MQRTPHRTSSIVLLIAAALFASGCSGKPSGSIPSPAKGSGKPAEEISVSVGAAERAAIPRKVEFVGSLAGIEQVTLSSEVEGTIEKLYADLGDTVRKGQILLAMAPEEFRFRREQAAAETAQISAKLGIAPEAETADIDGTSLVRKAIAEYNNARTDLERRKGLFEKNLIARKEADDAEARYLVAEANVRAAREEANNLLATLRSKRAQLSLAQKKLSDTQVRSPIDGSVEARLVSAGEYLKLGTPIFRLVNDRPIRMLGEVPEFYAASLAPGLAVELAVDGRPGKVYRGTLKRISPSSNVANRAIQVEAVFPNPSRELKSGFFGKGAVLVRVDRNAVTVPKQAVVTFAGIEKVFVVSGDTASERKVKLGEDLGERVEVTEGISPGDRVALSNTGKLVDGSRIKLSAEQAK